MGRDGITNLFENSPKESAENLSKNEIFRLQKVMDMKNKSQVINDSDKIMGAVMVDKTYVIAEWKNNCFTLTHKLNYHWRKWKR